MPSKSEKAPAKKAQEKLIKIFDNYLKHFDKEKDQLKPHKTGWKYVTRAQTVTSPEPNATPTEKFSAWAVSHFTYLNAEFPPSSPLIIENNFSAGIKPEEVLKFLSDILNNIFKDGPATELKEHGCMMVNFKNFTRSLEERKSPTSVRIDLTLQMIQAVIKERNLKKQAKFNDFVTDFQKIYPTLKGYAKAALVTELKNSLNNDDPKTALDDFVKTFKKVGSSGDIVRMLEDKKRERRSNVEYGLKIASIVGILAGVGIVTTGILMAKRLYDSKGASANFFKPLSQNVLEETVTIAKNIEKKRN